MELVPSGPSNGIGLTLSGATIVASTLSGALIFASSITGSTISSSTISGSTIVASTLSGSTILGGTLSGVTIVGSTISGLAATTGEVVAESAVERFIRPDRNRLSPGVGKAWAVFTVTGGTVTLRDSYNVSSITDNAQGDFSAVFTTQFATKYYTAAINFVQQTADNTQSGYLKAGFPPTTGVARFETLEATGTKWDPPVVCCEFHGTQ